jgi:hypothetical protein
MHRLIVNPGDKFGNWEFIKETGTRNKVRYGLFRCICGVEKEKSVKTLARGKSKSCGCQKGKWITKNSQKPFVPGEKYNRLTLLEEVESTVAPNCGKVYRRVLAKCDCGKVKVYNLNHVRGGFTKSCGCYCVEQTIKKCRTHGMKNTPTYSSWLAMKARCTNEKHDAYHNYGGRNISVCERWFKFEHFLEDMGVRPGLEYSIDRIDVNGNYCKENCKWSTDKEQNWNRRNNLFFQYQGEKLNLYEIAEKLNTTYGALWAKLKRFEWDLDLVLNHYYKEN